MSGGLLRRVACACVCGVVALWGVGVGVAQPLPNPADPSDPVMRSWWADPSARVQDSDARVTVRLVEFGGLGAKARLRVHNGLDRTVSDVVVRVQHSDPLADVEQGRVLLAGDQSLFSFIEPFQRVGSVAAGEDVDVVVDVPRVEDAGVYPFLFNINGVVEGQESYLDSERLLVPHKMASVGDVSVVVPLAAPVRVLPGETGEAPEQQPLILEEDFDVAPLTETLRTYRDFVLGERTGAAGCLALDPQVLLAVDRMSRGYRIADRRTSPVDETIRLRDSWWLDKPRFEEGDPAPAVEFMSELHKLIEVTFKDNQPSAVPAGIPGEDGAPQANNGGEDAGPNNNGQGTAGPIPSAASGPGCIISLPFAGADINAASRSGLDPFQGADAIEHILGVTPLSYEYAQTNFALAATLDAMGPDPITTPTSDPTTRYDYTIDSEEARRLTAKAAIQLQASQGNTLIMPTRVTPQDAHAILDAATEAIDRGATPTPAPRNKPESVDSPASLTDTEIVRARQQSGYIGDLTTLMVNDPQITLTNTEFTQPLRYDILRALSLYDRQSMHTHTQAVRRSDNILSANRDTLQQLRNSVSLLPPGNVYTRTSDSSPLLIVGRNGLPLPIDARVLYDAPGATIHVPDTVRIPAQGSITIQMTADLPGDSGIKLWLATESGNTISEPVDIRVQTAHISWRFIIAVGIALVVIRALVVFGKRKR